ncbi:hypothetical protein D3C72_1614760 [compost metagenome]
MHALHVQQREQGPQFDIRARFLHRFAFGRVGRCFIVFHEAGRQRPVTEARLDGPLAQQDLQLPIFFPDGNRADHHFRVLVMDGVAVGAHIARTVVAFRNGQADRMGAFGAEFHGQA